MTRTTASASPTTHSSLKTHSLHTAPLNGPKPLQLLHNNHDVGASSPNLSHESSPGGSGYPSAIDTTYGGLPGTPVSAKSLRPLRAGQGRRQSSISYISSPTSPGTPVSFTGAQFARLTASASTSSTQGAGTTEGGRQPLARSMSLGGRGGAHRYGQKRELVTGGEIRHSTGNIHTVEADASPVGPASPAPPTTLAEKHAELLHFIAQKESKCLELRQQLATHEAELLQLKRKWERIIARGFEKSTGDYSTLTTLPSIPSFNANDPDQALALHSPSLSGGPTVLEGIREGVQGVSRFISANISDFSKPPPSPSSPVSSWKPLHTPHRSNASSSMESDSTGTTRHTGSTTSRLSLSSVSSLGDSPVLEEDEEFTDFKLGVSGDISSTETDTTVSSSGSARPSKNLKSIRRRSRDAYSLTGIAATPLVAEPSTSGVDDLSYPSSTLSPTTNVEKERKAAKRASMSIGGLQSSFASSAWTDSIGKKWEELKEGSDSTNKNIKRASVLISDVSQSLYTAWNSPALSPQLSSLSSNQRLSSSTSTLLASSSTLSPATHGSTRKQRATLTPSPTMSLLDDSDEDQQVTIHASIMTPDSPLTPRPAAPASADQASVASTKKAEDDDEDWNW